MGSDFPQALGGSVHDISSHSPVQVEVDEPGRDGAVAVIMPGHSLKRRRMIVGKNADNPLLLDYHNASLQDSIRKYDIPHEDNFFHGPSFFLRLSVGSILSLESRKKVQREFVGEERERMIN
jgi:hypothetical protein